MNSGCSQTNSTVCCFEVVAQRDSADITKFAMKADGIKNIKSPENKSP